ncbi:MAG: nitrilase-related carbon-nitrogen hydrolase [Dehalococcoidia bacterium]
MEPFTVACCQIRAHDLEDAGANLAQILDALDEAGRAGAQLVLLPECAYPAYYVRDADPYARPGVRPFAEACALFGAKAKQYGYWLAAGMAAPGAGGTLTNSGVVFGPDGLVRGRYDKTFLWHFDTFWFEKGRAYPVFDAGFAKFGVLICADGRQPEVARMLRVNGAEVICDLTAWVSWARTPEQLTTTQCEYLMPVRAFENGVWVAAADKWGPEDETIVYAGRSCVIGPDGTTRAAAASTGNAVVLHRVVPEAPLTAVRRPALYGSLTAEFEATPAAALEREPVVPAAGAGRVVVSPGPRDWHAGEVARRYRALRQQDADVVVFPGMTGLDGWQVQLGDVEDVVRDLGGVAVVPVRTTGCNLKESVAIVTPERTFEHIVTHGKDIDLGEAPAPIVPTPAGNLGVMAGDEGLVPEVARCLALQGADILTWSLFESLPMAERVTRCRADENRVYAAVAWPGGGLVANPDGALLTAVPEGIEVAMAAPVHRAMSRWKEKAPGTHVFRDRTPEAYGPLVK